jgi:hypothetical protein
MILYASNMAQINVESSSFSALFTGAVGPCACLSARIVGVLRGACSCDNNISVPERYSLSHALPSYAA